MSEAPSFDEDGNGMEDSCLLANANVADLALLNEFLKFLPSRIRVICESLIDNVTVLVECNGPVVGRD
jgi:hypothetical protein